MKRNPGNGRNAFSKAASSINYVIGYAVLAFIFLVLPFLTTYDVLVEDIIIWSLFTMGFNLAFGFTGMVSLGHGVFFGVSAFTIGILSLSLEPEHCDDSHRDSRGNPHGICGGIYLFEEGQGGRA